MSENVLSVAEFVSALKSLVMNHSAFQHVAVVGEVSNFNAHHSGHFYFSLKDKDARISCVMFKSKASRVLFKPKNGDKVVVMGYCDVFEANGSVQIYAERMNLDGLGDLHLRYEALKKAYQLKGYFDQAHKKALPLYPKRIGVITGKDSAAYADISRTLSQRWPMAQQVDLFAYVQGEYAIDSIISQIEDAQDLNLDALILARGGGSIEDLWAFNEERVIEAVFQSKVPIVSGVGHESDVTLVEFVADYRAATPTAAAVLLTPNVEDVIFSLRDYKNRFYLGFRNRFRVVSSQYQEILNRTYLKNPKRYFDEKQQYLDYTQSRIVNQMKRLDETKEYLNRINQQNAYALKQRMSRDQNELIRKQEHMISHTQKRLLKSRHQSDAVTVFLTSQRRHLVRNMSDLKLSVSHSNERIQAQMMQILTLNQRAFNDIIKSLDLLSPLKIMGRGYALVYDEDTLVKSVNDVELGSALRIRFQDGSVEAKVEKREHQDE